jgi:hypothetical protein
LSHDGAPERPIDVIRRVNNTWAVRPFETVRDALLGASDCDDAVRRFEEVGLPVDPLDPDVYGVYPNRDDALAAIRAD